MSLKASDIIAALLDVRDRYPFSHTSVGSTATDPVVYCWDPINQDGLDQVRSYLTAKLGVTAADVQVVLRKRFTYVAHEPYVETWTKEVA